MLRINKILLNAISLLTVVLFFFSTTGFMTYRHICDHHEEKVSLTEIEDCCDAEKMVPESSCCEPVDHCSSEADQSSSCCDEENAYVKLANWYLTSDKDDLIPGCTAESVLFKDTDMLEEEERDSNSSNFTTKGKKPKLPKYRLYRSVKLDPPLI